LDAASSRCRHDRALRVAAAMFALYTQRFIKRDKRTHGVDLETAMTHAPTTDGWRRSFEDQSQRQFAEQFADEIVLEATTLAKSVEGKHSVAAVLTAASSIYESLEFTAEAQCASTTYLQWRATAFGNMKIEGVTVLERDMSSKIVAAAIHHRPLGAVLRFSAEIRERLAGVISGDYFL
jgi:hypothetical protein